MATQSLQKHVFPGKKTRSTLKLALDEIVRESSALRPEWEPLLNSMRVVGSVLALEGLFSFKLPPDKVVKKGGYDSVEEALDDMTQRIQKLWDKHVGSKP